LPIDGVTRTELLARQPLGVDRAVDIEVGRADVAAAAGGEIIDGPNRRQRQHTLGRTALAGLDADGSQATVDTLGGIDVPGVATVGLDRQEGADPSETGQGRTPGRHPEDITASQIVTHDP
jgi:hypothetical protein